MLPPWADLGPVGGGNMEGGRFHLEIRKSFPATAPTVLGWNELPWEDGSSPSLRVCVEAEEASRRAAEEEL